MTGCIIHTVESAQKLVEQYESLNAGHDSDVEANKETFLKKSYQNAFKRTKVFDRKKLL